MASQTADITARLISDLMRDFDLTRDQAAGFAGNLGHETRGFQDLKEVGGGGRGYGQWTGARRKTFESFLERNGLDLNSYEGNYGYLKHELTKTPEKAVLTKLRNAPDVNTATRVVSNSFLRPGVPRMDSRLNYANQAVLTALDVTEPVNPASTQNLSTMRAAAARQNAPQPMQRSVPRDSTLQSALNSLAREKAQPVKPSPLDYVRTSASPAPAGLQAALNAKVAGNAIMKPANRDIVQQIGDLSPKRNVMTPAQVYSQGGPTRTPASTMLSQKAPNVATWDDFYKGITPPKVTAPNPASEEDRVNARMNALVRADQQLAPGYNEVTQAQRNALSTVPPKPSVNVDDLYKGVYPVATVNPVKAQPINAVYNPTNPFVNAALSAQNQAPKLPSQALSAGYNVMSPAQRNAISALPQASVMKPPVQQAIQRPIAPVMQAPARQPIQATVNGGAPQLPTIQSIGGYLYAPGPNGQLTQVGRDPRAPSSPSGGGNAYTRMVESQGGGGGPASLGGN